MSSRNAKILLYFVTALCLLGITLFRQSRQDTNNGTSGSFTQLEGTVFHTIYHIQYEDTTNYQADINRLFREFDASLSMFNDTSLISRVNQGDTSVVANHYLRTVIDKSLEVSQLTQGAFDITVAPLVNLWGFGFKNRENVSREVVDSVLQLVGYQKVRLLPDGRIAKDDPRVSLDFSSIAKGYMCDVVADFLQQRGICNYMVEIGGEIACGGINPQQHMWGIGINEPTEDSLHHNNRLQDVMRLSNCGVATSGNYRNFYYQNGQRYAHTIDPTTGYPVQKDVLSATVVAPDCMTADAYATAFMVLGSQEAQQVLDADTTLMAYFIVADSTGTGNQVIYSPGLRRMLDNPQ